MKRVLCACMLALVGAVAAVGQRLPEVAVPDHYTLKLQPNFQTNTFGGNEQIDVRVLKPTKSITLNAMNIEFHQVEITAGGTTQTAQVSKDEKAEMATLTVPNTIPAGAAQIKIRYKGELNDKLRGFYRSEANGRKYAVTQFEPTDARQAFPSFDEPAYKATYDITVIAPKQDMVISNSPVASDVAGPATGEHTVKFMTTPKMSSYLVAVLVGEFDCLKGESDGIPVRVCTVPGKQEMGQFALKWAENILHYYDNYYGIKYPFRKLDLIGIPDFEAGAMENTGAITFRDVALLVDPKTASVDNEKEVALVVAHEMAHQWFGDLVTMKWWNDIWLNEGFATWMETKPVAAVRPDWDIPQDEEMSAIQAMRTDSLKSTRAIRTNAETPAQINELFDSIAYNKTAAVLRMIESYVTPEAFRTGVNAYLKAHAYGNATAENFWTKMTQVSHRPVDRIMRSYVDQPGIPIVSVSERCANDERTLSQQRFSYAGEATKAAASEVWSVPVCMKTSSGSSQCEVLSARQQTMKSPGCSDYPDQNVGGHGYYRSNYSDKVTGEIANDFQTFSPVEQLWSIDNEWALVRSGTHSIKSYMDMAKAVGGTESYGAWQTVRQQMQAINEDLVSDADRKPFEEFARKLAGPMMQKLGWTPRANDTYGQRSVRATAFYILGYFGRDPKAIAEAQNIAQGYLKSPATTDPMLAGPALSIAAQNGGADFYNQVLAATEATTDPDVYHRLVFTLTGFRDPSLVTKTLDLALSNHVRSQDAPMVFAAVLGNPAARTTAWSFIQSHWSEVVQKTTIWGAAVVVRSTAAFCDEGARKDVQQFFAAHPLPSAQRGLQQSLEAIDSCTAFKASQQTNLAQWLNGSVVSGAE